MGRTQSLSGAPLALYAYGKHRKALGLPGGDWRAVSRAIKTQRLVKSVVHVDGEPKIIDAARADAEWARNTDLSKAPGTVKAQAAAAVTPSSRAAVAHPGNDHSLAAASTREKNARADLVELEYRTKAGELVPARVVEATWADIVVRVRTAMLSVPSKFKTADPNLTHAQLATLNDIIVQQLEALAPKGAATKGAAA